jgi:hypothetical protein
MQPQVPIRRLAWRTLAVSPLLVLLYGCSCNPPTPDLPAWGTVKTDDDRLFTLTGPKQTITIGPGFMKVIPAFGRYAFGPEVCSSALTIESRGHQLEIPLHAGALTGGKINIFGAAHGLSANLVGFESIVSQNRMHERSTSESCTTSGYCSKEVTKEECHDGKCEKKTVSESGYHSDCPGSRPVTIHLDWVKTRYQIAFVDPMNTKRTFGTFDGLTSEWEIETGRTTGTCTAH